MNQFQLVHKLAQEKRSSMQRSNVDVLRDQEDGENPLPAGCVRCGCGRLATHPGICSYRFQQQ